MPFLREAGRTPSGVPQEGAHEARTAGLGGPRRLGPRPRVAIFFLPLVFSGSLSLSSLSHSGLFGSLRFFGYVFLFCLFLVSAIAERGLAVVWKEYQCALCPSTSKPSEASCLSLVLPVWGWTFLGDGARSLSFPIVLFGCVRARLDSLRAARGSSHVGSRASLCLFRFFAGAQPCTLRHGQRHRIGSRFLAFSFVFPQCTTEPRKHRFNDRFAVSKVQCLR